MKIIVLKITPYKDKDGIIHAISESGVVDILARSILTPKTTYSFLNTNLVVADVELLEGNYKYPILKRATSIFVPLKEKCDFGYLNSLLCISEMFSSLIQDDEIVDFFNILCHALLYLKKTDNVDLTLIYLFAQIFSRTGFALEVDKCVYCHKKTDIKGFSFSEGGFVCKNCLSEDMEIDSLSQKQMLIFRSIYKLKKLEDFHEELNHEDAIEILKKIYGFVIDAYGTDIKNLKLFLN